MRALPTAFSLLVAPAFLSAEPQRPPAIKHSEQTVEVAMLGTMPRPCAAITTPNTTLYLSLRRLADHVAYRPHRIVDEHDYAADLRARRAAGLLDRLSGLLDDDGCRTLQSTMSGHDGYAVLHEIKDGEVFARSGRSGSRIPVLLLRTLESRGATCGSGTMHVAIPLQDGNELNFSSWIGYGGACPTVSKPPA